MHDELMDKAGYLERLSKPLQEKLRVGKYIPENAVEVLDVGCADGTVTLALAQLFPEKRFLGIDLDEEFVAAANQEAAAQCLQNVRFERVYLRELLAREERFDSVSFISVLHEFYSYGEGISSVLKALADAHELLRTGGDIVIRDMILLAYTKRTNYLTHTIAPKVTKDDTLTRQVQEFESHFGPLDSIYTVNHFLLKYFYTDNWEHECKEHYVPVTLEEYQRIFELLGMELVLRDQHLLPFLRQKWIDDFGLSDTELDPLVSTGFLVARKRA